MADDTGMHYYDAELLRFRAHTHNDTASRDSDLAASRVLARRQGAPVLELRSALDEFHLRGEPARAAVIDALSRLPTGTTIPERQRAAALMYPAAPM